MALLIHHLGIQQHQVLHTRTAKEFIDYAYVLHPEQLFRILTYSPYDM